jgi:hypothetical protein
MLSVKYKPFMLSVYAECHYAECHYAECRSALLKSHLNNVQSVHDLKKGFQLRHFHSGKRERSEFLPVSNNLRRANN